MKEGRQNNTRKYLEERVTWIFFFFFCFLCACERRRCEAGIELQETNGLCTGEHLLLLLAFNADHHSRIRKIIELIVFPPALHFLSEKRVES